MDSDDKAVLTIICTLLICIFATVGSIWCTHSRVYQAKVHDCITNTISPDLCNKY